MAPASLIVIPTVEARRDTRRIRVGGVPVGGGAPVSVQSMTNTDTRDVRTTVAQIRSLAREGCEIARVAVPDAKAAAAFGKIRAGSPIPVIADIHFDHRLAIACADAGADCLRINPGNVGGEKNTIEVLAGGEGEPDPGADRRQRGVGRERPSREVRGADAESPRGERRAVPEDLREGALHGAQILPEGLRRGHHDRGVPPLLPPVRFSACTSVSRRRGRSSRGRSSRPSGSAFCSRRGSATRCGYRSRAPPRRRSASAGRS